MSAPKPTEALKALFSGLDAAHDAKMARRAARGPVPSRTFILEEEEWETFDAWYQAHRKVCPHLNYKLAQELGLPHAAAGGAVTYLFTPTGIGLNVSVRCACGDKVDCTDYDSW
jgi:hypothetical protein